MYLAILGTWLPGLFQLWQRGYCCHQWSFIGLDSVVYIVQYDFTHGKFNGIVKGENGKLVIKESKIPPTSNGAMLVLNMLWSPLVSSLPWRKLRPTWKTELKWVIISAPFCWCFCVCNVHKSWEVWQLSQGWIFTCKIMKLDRYLTPLRKNNSKLIKNSNVNPETMKYLKESIGTKLLDMGIGNNFLYMIPEA